jgi:transcriptional regulator with XRE-family HTH domain
MPTPDAARKRNAISPEIAFGRALRQARLRGSMSQEELAERSGYHRTYIGQLERGEKSPSLRTLFNLASTLSVRLSRLVMQIEREAGKG